MPRTRRTAGNGHHGRLKNGAHPAEHAIWKMMLQKCLNVSCSQYPKYGGRGVQVCERWRDADGFANFLADVGPQPHPGAGLRLRDPDGDFEPGNVEWDATRKGRTLDYDGRSQSLNDWAQELDVRPATIRARLGSGWSVERALTTRVPYRFCARRTWHPARPTKGWPDAPAGDGCADTPAADSNEPPDE